jgi:hypothetical protein
MIIGPPPKFHEIQDILRLGCLGSLVLSVLLTLLLLWIFRVI